MVRDIKERREAGARLYPDPARNAILLAMSSPERIAKNAAFLMVATASQKVLAFGAFIFVARLLGREQTGAFFYAISITSIFVTLADLGMTPVVIRAVAGNRDDGSSLLGAALRAKLVLAPLAILAALGYTLAFGASSVILATVAIACLVMTADTFHLVLYGALRGRQNLRPEALGMFVGQCLTAVASVGAAWFSFGPVGLAVALLIGSTWNVVWGLIQLKRFEITVTKPHKRDYRQLLKEAVPFGLAGLAVKVYSYVDTLFLKQFHGTHEVGLYAVGYKLTYALQFLPLTFTAALYPALASAYANKHEAEIRTTFLGSLRLMAAIGFPLAAGLSALAHRIIPLVYGQEFVGGIPAFQILPWVLLPIFLDFPIGALLNATHRAHLKTTAMVVTMVINIGLNALLVPPYASVGAAWAGVISFWGLYAIGSIFTRQNAGSYWVFVSFTLRGLLASGVSWYAWHVIGNSMSLPAACLFGGAIAVVMAFVVRFVRVDDVYALLKRFRTSAPRVELIHD